LPTRCNRLTQKKRRKSAD